jgi:hypothetical protein
VADTKSNTARLSREQEQTAFELVHEEYEDVFEEADLLSTKRLPSRAGYTQRWVRTDLKGQSDQANVFRKFNKGWRPRLANTVPQGAPILSINFQGADVVGYHGMVLMERKLEAQAQERIMNMRKTELQMDAVKHNMFKIHEPGRGMSRPSMDVSSKVSTGRGREPVVDD